MGAYTRRCVRNMLMRACNVASACSKGCSPSLPGPPGEAQAHAPIGVQAARGGPVHGRQREVRPPQLPHLGGLEPHAGLLRCVVVGLGACAVCGSQGTADSLVRVGAMRRAMGALGTERTHFDQASESTRYGPRGSDVHAPGRETVASREGLDSAFFSFPWTQCGSRASLGTQHNGLGARCSSSPWPWRHHTPQRCRHAAGT